jgi:hypothetical protein
MPVGRTLRVPGGRTPPPGTPARLLALLLAVAGLVAAAAGCSSSPAEPPAATLAQLHALPPIYQYLIATGPVDRRISTAEQRLTATCMARYGFRFQPTTPATDAEAADAPTPFGLESLDRPTPEKIPPPLPESRTQQYGRALNGDEIHRISVRGARLHVTRPATGCTAEAQQRLLGAGRVRWLQVLVLLYEAEEDARQLLDTDPEFRTANARWSTCMRQGSFSYPDPMTLFRALSPDVDLRASPATRADLVCKTDTGFLHTAYTRLAAAQQRVLDRDPTVVRDWTALRARQDVAARAILGGG